MAVEHNATSNKRFLGGENPDGNVVGKDASDPVAFHGATPVVQASAITSLANDAATSLIATAVNAIITMARNKGLIES